MRRLSMAALAAVVIFGTLTSSASANPLLWFVSIAKTLLDEAAMRPTKKSTVDVAIPGNLYLGRTWVGTTGDLRNRMLSTEQRPGAGLRISPATIADLAVLDIGKLNGFVLHSTNPDFCDIQATRVDAARLTRPGSVIEKGALKWELVIPIDRLPIGGYAVELHAYIGKNGQEQTPPFGLGRRDSKMVLVAIFWLTVMSREQIIAAMNTPEIQEMMQLTSGLVFGVPSLTGFRAPIDPAMAEFSGMAAQARRNGVPAPGTTVAERVLGTGQQLPQGGYGGSETEAEFQSFGPADSADDSPAPKPRPVSYDGERFVQAAPAPVQAPSAKPQCTCGWQKDVWHNTARIWGYDPGCGAALLRPSVFDKRPDFAGVPFFFCRLGPDSKTIAPIGGRFYFALPGRGEDVALTGEDEMCREVPGVHGDYGHIFSDSTNLHVGDVVVVYTGLPDRGGRPIVKFTVESGKGYWLVLPCDEQGNPVK